MCEGTVRKVREDLPNELDVRKPADGARRDDLPGAVLAPAWLFPELLADE